MPYGYEEEPEWIRLEHKRLEMARQWFELCKEYHNALNYHEKNEIGAQLDVIDLNIKANKQAQELYEQRYRENN
jgi:hypothetical protein